VIKEKKRTKRGIYRGVVRFILGILGSCLLFLAILSMIFFISPTKRTEIIDGLAHRVALGILNDYFYGDISIKSAHFDPDTAILSLTDTRLRLNATDNIDTVYAPEISIYFDRSTLRKTPKKYLLALDKIEAHAPIFDIKTTSDGSLNILKLSRDRKKPKSGKPSMFCPKIVVTDGTAHLSDNFKKYASENVTETITDLSFTLQLGGDYLPFSLTADVIPEHFAKSGAAYENILAKLKEEQTISIHGGIDMQDKDRAEIRAEINNLNGNIWLDFLPKKLPLDAKVMSGDIERAEIIITADKTAEKWHAALSLEALLSQIGADITINKKIIPLRNLSSRVVYDGKNIAANGITARVNGIETSGEFILSDVGKENRMRLQLIGKNARVESITEIFPSAVNDYKPQGIIESFTADIIIADGSFSIQGNVLNAHALHAKIGQGQLSLSQVGLNYVYANDILNLSNIKATLAGSGNGYNILTANNILNATLHLNLKAVKNGEAQSGVFNVEAQNINKFGITSALKGFTAIDDFLKDYLSDVDFIASAEAIGNIKSDGSVAFHMAPTGIVTIKDMPEYSSALTGVISADFSKSTSIIVRSATIKNPDFSLHATGEIMDGKISANFEAADINLQKIGNAIPVHSVKEQFKNANIGGKAYIKGAVYGSGDDLQIMAALRVLEGRYNDINGMVLNANLSGSLLLTPSVLNIDDLFIAAPDSGLEIALENVEFTYGVTPKISVKSVDISPTTLEQLASSFGIKDFPIKGFLSSEIVYEDSTKDNLSAVLTVFNPTFMLREAKIDLEKLVMDVTINGTEGITINNAALSLGGLKENPTINIYGTASTKEINLSVESDPLPLRQFLNNDPSEKIGLCADGRFNLPVLVSGDVALFAHLTLENIDGAWQNGAVIGNLNAREQIEVAQVPYSDLSADFLYTFENGEFSISNAEISRSANDKNYTLAITDSIFSTRDIDRNSITVNLKGKGENKLADISGIKNDIQDMLKNASKIYAFETSAPQENVDLLKMGENIFALLPEDLDGKLELALSITGDIRKRPIIRTVLRGSELLAEGQKLPETLVDVTYNTFDASLTVKDLRFIGGENPDLYIATRENSVIAFPNSENPDGKMDFDIEIQNLNLEYLSKHKSLEFLSNYKGTLDISVSAEENSTMTHPGVYSSIDWQSPVVNGIAFDTFSTILELDHDLTAKGNYRIYIGQRVLGALGDAVLYPLGAQQAGTPPISISGFIPFSLNERVGLAINDEFSLSLKLPRQQVSAFSAYLKGKNPLFDSLKEGHIGGVINIGGTLNKPRFINNSHINLNIPRVSLIDAAAGAVEGVSNIDTVINFTSSIDSYGNPQNRVVINELSADFDPFKIVPKVSVIEQIKRTLGLSKKPATRLARSTFYANGNLTINTPKDGWLESEIGSISNFIDYNVALNFVNMPLRFGAMLNGHVNGRLNLTNSREPSDNNRPILAGIVAANNTKMVYAVLDDMSEALKLPFDPLLSVLILFNGQNDFSFSLGSKGLFEAVNGYLPINPSHINYDSLLPEEIDGIISELIRVADANDAEMEKAKGFLTNVRRSNINNRDISIGILSGNLSQIALNLQYSLVPQKANVKLPGGTLTMQEKPAVSGIVTYNTRINTERPFNITAHGSARAVIPNYTVLVEIDSDNLLSDLLLINTTFSEENIGAPQTVLSPINISILYAAPGSPTLTEYDFFNRFMGLGSIINALNNTEGSDDELRVALANIGLQSILGDSFMELADSLYLDNISFTFDPEMNLEVTALTKEWRIADNLAVHLGVSTIFDGNQQVRNWVEIGLPQKSEEELSKLGNLRWLKDLSIVGEYSSYDNFNTSQSKFRTNLSLQYRWRFMLGNWQIN